MLRQGFFFFFKQKTAYEMQRGLVGSEMCIRDSINAEYMGIYQMQKEILLDDTIKVSALNREGKFFELVSRIDAESQMYDIKVQLDINTDIYPIKLGGVLITVQSSSNTHFVLRGH
eukprot:TRINITY_DN2864_c0_g2_i4.p4 TRINITY_DN2864_c0_g2~~TRINITY_DN2864_c0_g2_i4.p4  ORF type:complete len:116 (-),score=31.26 TRINITY_DN2864_c0_g2_i4:328-675(-)